MATAPDIFTKTVTYNGTEPCLRMQTRGLLQRLTGLPPNWKKARIGMIASLTGAAGDNVTPVAETINVSDLTKDFFFGLSDGAAFPGVAGGHFVGVHLTSGINMVVSKPSSWQIAADTGSTALMWRIIATNGVTLHAGIGGSMANIPTMTDPTAVAAYCFGLVLEMDVSVTGTLTTALGLTSNLNRADATQMSSLLNGAVAGSESQTGGWWSGSVNVACQDFFMRWPMSLNSLRVHNYDFIKIS